MAATRGQIAFHSGSLFAKTATGTPLQVGTLQETTFDFKSSNKELFGENQFAEAVGRGNTKISGKAKTGRFNGALLNQVFFSQPSANVAATADLLALGESQTIASGAATVTNAADFVEDLGVVDATGAPLTKVASSPATGQYSVNESTGVYSFNTGDNGDTVKISYLYSSSATGAGTLTIENQAAGEAPTFKAVFSQRFQGKTLTLVLNAVVAESLGFGFKQEEFALPEFGFMAQADSLGIIGRLSMSSYQ